MGESVMVERQTIVTWFKPSEKRPPEHTDVVVCISFKGDRVTYDHAMVIGNWADDDDEWLFEDPLANHYRYRAKVHAWADLEPYGGD